MGIASADSSDSPDRHFYNEMHFWPLLSGKQQAVVMRVAEYDCQSDVYRMTMIAWHGWGTRMGDELAHIGAGSIIFASIAGTAIGRSGKPRLDHEHR